MESTGFRSDPLTVDSQHRTCNFEVYSYVPASALCSSSKRIIGQTKRVIEQTNWSIANGRTFFLRERPTCGGCSLGLYRLERVSLLGGHRFLLRSLSNECDRRSGRHALGRGRLCGRRRQRPLSRLASTTGTLLLLGLRPAGSRARRYGTRVGKELLADPWRIAEITSGRAAAPDADAAGAGLPKLGITVPLPGR